MSNFIQKELCPFCREETEILYVDLAEVGYSLECLDCGEVCKEVSWRARVRKLDHEKAATQSEEDN